MTLNHFFPCNVQAYIHTYNSYIHAELCNIKFTLQDSVRRQWLELQNQETDMNPLFKMLWGKNVIMKF